jgi:hypothetical protein
VSACMLTSVIEVTAELFSNALRSTVAQMPVGLTLGPSTTRTSPRAPRANAVDAAFHAATDAGSLSLNFGKSIPFPLRYCSSVVPPLDFA